MKEIFPQNSELLVNAHFTLLRARYTATVGIDTAPTDASTQCERCKKSSSNSSRSIRDVFVITNVTVTNITNTDNMAPISNNGKKAKEINAHAQKVLVGRTLCDICCKETGHISKLLNA